MEITVLAIPGTPHICLASDRFITPSCMRSRRLDFDQSILGIPSIAEQLKPGRITIDVGAFIGDTAIMFEARGCIVYAFEPRPDAFACLQHNLPNAITICRPVGMRGQTVTFNENQLWHSDSSNFGGRQVRAANNPEAMRCLSLDELNPHECHFIKIDAEGFEPYVLQGGERLIRRTRPVMHIEVNQPALRDHGFDGQRSVYGLLEGWGYKVIERQGERVGTDHPWDIVCIPM